MGCGIAKSLRNLKPDPRQTDQSSRVSLNSFIKVSSEDLVGKYQMIKKIGSGSYSNVFLCLKKSTCQKSALKVIQKDSLSNEMLDDELKCKKAAILRELDHPNIIKCFEIFEDASHIILSEEFIKGGTLLTYTKPKLPLTKIASILYQLLSAIVYCHDRHIVHRDIKLENIFVVPGSDMHIKLGDFGLATIKHPNEPINGFCGTLMFMAPEVFKDKYNEKIDIWSIGVLLYILMTGNSPYTAANKESLENQVRNFPLSCKRKGIQALGKDFAEYLEGFLKVNPDERFSAKEALMHPWLQKFKDEDLSVHYRFIQRVLNIPHKSLMQKSISLYVNAFFANEKYLNELSKYFQRLDKDGNGTIDRAELIDELKLSIDDIKSAKIVEDFFNNFDLNGNGVIDYMEFLTAFCLEDSVLSEQNLEKVFTEVDKSKKGFVTKSEIENFLGFKFGDLPNKIKNEARISRKIRFQEFKYMAKNIQ